MNLEQVLFNKSSLLNARPLNVEHSNSVNPFFAGEFTIEDGQMFRANGDFKCYDHATKSHRYYICVTRTYREVSMLQHAVKIAWILVNLAKLMG